MVFKQKKIGMATLTKKTAISYKVKRMTYQTKAKQNFWWTEEVGRERRWWIYRKGIEQGDDTECNLWNESKAVSSYDVVVYIMNSIKVAHIIPN